MTRQFILLVFVLGCGGDVEPSDGCDYSLPARDSDGSAWPSFDEAQAMWRDCSRIAPPSRRRGSCSDGKLFIDYNGGFSGETLYFRDGTLAGLRRWTDIVIEGSCRGGLGETSCEEIDVEDLSCP